MIHQLPSVGDIEKISMDILRGSKAFDIFPTPVDKIVDYTELVINKKADISIVHENYLKTAPAALFRALKKVRGLFDRKQKTIYLDLSQMPSRKKFVKLHETAHGVLPWQQKIHDLLADDDDSLGAHVTEEFEAEANYFASVTLFQHDRFLDECRKLNLGIDAAMVLAKKFGASVHASLRRCVEQSSKRCALLVLEKSTLITSSPAFSKRNFITSQRFQKAFGSVDIPDNFGLQWDFAKDFYYRKKGIVPGTVELITESGSQEFTYQFFNNSYNGFVLIYPAGEKQSSKTNIIIKASH